MFVSAQKTATQKLWRIWFRSRCRAWEAERYMIVVRSRDGGVVTKDCDACGTAHAFRMEEVEELAGHLYCLSCEGTLEGGKNAMDNYEVSCAICESHWVLARLVPKYTTTFRYPGAGYWMESDA